MLEIRNPKHEIRDKSQIRMIEIRNPLTGGSWLSHLARAGT